MMKVLGGMVSDFIKQFTVTTMCNLSYDLFTVFLIYSICLRTAANHGDRGSTAYGQLYGFYCTRQNFLDTRQYKGDVMSGPTASWQPVWPTESNLSCSGTGATQTSPIIPFQNYQSFVSYLRTHFHASYR